MKLIKLTNPLNMTYKDMLWGEGVTNELSESETQLIKLCGPTVIHAFAHPWQVWLYHYTYRENPHCTFTPWLNDAVWWEAEGEVVVSEITKVGCLKLTTIKRIEKTNPPTLDDIRNLVKDLLPPNILANNTIVDHARSLECNNAAIKEQQYYKRMSELSGVSICV